MCFIPWTTLWQKSQLFCGCSLTSCMQSGCLHRGHRLLEVFLQYACCAWQAGLTAAFRVGLSDVVSPAWITMFAPGELQTLISGAGTRTPASVPLDLHPVAGRCWSQRHAPQPPSSVGSQH